MLSDAAGPLNRELERGQLSRWRPGRLVGGLDRPFEERQAWRDEARSVFEQTGDEWGSPCTGGAWQWRPGSGCARRKPPTHASGRSSTLNGRAPRTRLENFLRNRLIAAFVYTPLPVDDSIERIRTLGAGHGLLGQAWERGIVGRLSAMKGDFARGRELVRGQRARPISTPGSSRPRVASRWARLTSNGSRGTTRRRECPPRRDRHPRDDRRACLLSDGRSPLATMLYAQRRFDEVREWCDRRPVPPPVTTTSRTSSISTCSRASCSPEGPLRRCRGCSWTRNPATRRNRNERIEAYAHAHLAELSRRRGGGRGAQARSKALEIADRKGDVALGSRLREWLVVPRSR